MVLSAWVAARKLHKQLEEVFPFYSRLFRNRKTYEHRIGAIESLRNALFAIEASVHVRSQMGSANLLIPFRVLIPFYVSLMFYIALSS
jgi:hypothetical protein